jgi:hypothetical protein
LTVLEHRLLDRVGDGGHVALAGSGGEEEGVHQRQRLGDVEGEQVLGALALGRRAATFTRVRVVSAAVIGMLLSRGPRSARRSRPAPAPPR